MILSLYIVSKAGQPLYFYDFQKMENQVIEDATLFSGMISAIRGFLQEMEIGDVTSFETNKNIVHIHPIEDLAYVLIVDKSSKYSDDIIQELLQEFTEKIVIDNSDDNISYISKKENQLLNQMITMIYSTWNKNNKESDAARKIQDDLW